ncbi:hypothetical protein DVH24_021127 [Malus domestica]|uniref:ER membrane protein complex subunit 7 beta-sandwich domain-containing protein n=1 Tax=Malus domestica TaxID=3750 RepID=A0A498JDI6_MALDO|nr:hypothetical protein DVH24_021127 [Malus domestica]
MTAICKRREGKGRKDPTPFRRSTHRTIRIRVRINKCGPDFAGYNKNTASCVTPDPQNSISISETLAKPLCLVMARSWRSNPVVLVLFLQLCLSLISSSLAVSPGSADGYTIHGRVKIPPSLGVKGFAPYGKISNIKVILNGGQSVTFLRPDGFFTLYPICSLDKDISNAVFVRVDVSARNPGKVQAALTENRRPLNEFVLEPLREEQYYEIREPFSIMSLVKSPMGLMVGFMLIVVFLMPKLVENMDPEEMRRTQEEMRNQGVPSLTSFFRIPVRISKSATKSAPPISPPNHCFALFAVSVSADSESGMEGLPTMMKSERRWRSKPLQTSKPSILMAFFSCVAWLYVAGRLWQDAENRTVLSNLLNKNLGQRPGEEDCES